MRAVRPTTNYEMWVDLFILFYFLTHFIPFQCYGSHPRPITFLTLTI